VDNCRFVVHMLTASIDHDPDLDLYLTPIMNRMNHLQVKAALCLYRTTVCPVDLHVRFGSAGLITDPQRTNKVFLHVPTS
jgi:hypothetical protein